MSCTYIMTDNFIDTDVVSNATVSSEQTAFPVENIYNKQRRSKVWRSNGFWEITSANKTLVFRETTGVDLTATLTEGDYSSTTSFLSEIKTQLESVGGSTYTLEQDTTTKKIKITSDGGGGGGIFTLRWTASTGLASTLGFSSSTDDSGALSYTADELKIHTSEWIKWDFGISANPQAFILIGARNSPLKISPSAEITLQGNETDVWSSPSYETSLTYDDNVISILDSDGLHSEELRYWRLEITDTANPNGFVEIGSIFLGDFFNTTRGGAQFPFNGQYIDRSVTVFSEGGQTFSDVLEQSESFDLEWFGLTVADKELIDYHFERVGTAVPFFVSADSDAAFSSSSNYYIRYMKYETEPTYSLVSPGNYTIRMRLREEL